MAMAHHTIQYTQNLAENAGSVLLATKAHQPLWQHSYQPRHHENFAILPQISRDPYLDVLLPLHSTEVLTPLQLTSKSLRSLRFLSEEFPIPSNPVLFKTLDPHPFRYQRDKDSQTTIFKITFKSQMLQQCILLTMCLALAKLSKAAVSSVRLGRAWGFNDVQIEAASITGCRTIVAPKRL